MLDGFPFLRVCLLIREVVHPTAGPMRLLGAAVEIDGLDEDAVAPPPLLGEHTDAVLRELGHSGEAIRAIRERAIIR